MPLEISARGVIGEDLTVVRVDLSYRCVDSVRCISPVSIPVVRYPRLRGLRGVHCAE